MENSLSISEKYIEALKRLTGWATVSEWAIKVGEVYPDILEKADREARGQKNDTTGLREIAARISSNISRGAYRGIIEIDESERPRKVRSISEGNPEEHEEKEIEEDLAPLTRHQKIQTDEYALSTKDRYRITEIQAIIDQLRSLFDLDFEFEHAKAILNSSDPGSHHPDNIQILLKTHNRQKGKNNWRRFSIEEQIDYIRAVVRVQSIVADRMGVQLEEDVLEQVITRLKMVY